MDHRLLLLPLLCACSPDLDVVTSAPGCADVDYDNPLPERVVAEEGDGEWVVRHENVFQSCDATPVIEVGPENGDLAVYERWEPGTDESCQTCYDPQITINDPPRGKYDVRWYVEGDDTPFETVSFRVQ